ncbi:MAG: RNA-binding domain-containing protein [Candidatus Hydrothermarchaeaceae archaeon]
MELFVEAEVYPTESREKVEKAVRNIFDVELVFKGGRIVGRSRSVKSLSKLQQLISRRYIRDTARHILLASAKAGKISFRMNKQAAYMGAVNFAEESQLGSIRVEIADKDIDELIDRIASSATL